MLLHDSNYMFNKYKENSKLLKYLYLLWKNYGSDSQCIEDVLSDLLSSDAVDDRVETAWKEQVQYAEENPNGCRETVSYSIWEESCEYDGQTNMTTMCVTQVWRALALDFPELNTELNMTV